ncbi:hypothetical protein FACS1894166_08310 [Bacilli bacterium]|nr:hypothetical protein FACS1894166_08310 [Bacilli bacterium]
MVRTPQAKHQEENFKKMGANRGLLEQWIPFTTEVEKICDSGEDERGTNIETEIKNTEL